MGAWVKEEDAGVKVELKDEGSVKVEMKEEEMM